MASAGQVRLGTPQGRWVLFAVVLGSGLAGIDATVVNVAIPTIGEDLDADFTTLQWVVTGYALTLASFILVGGVLGDRFGRKRLFVVGVAWFTGASLVCGLAPGGAVLVAARVLQGVGGALLTPASLAIIQSGFAPADRSRAIGAWSGLGGVATAIGPFAGGWLVDVASWRLVFLINLPVAAVVLLAARHVPETRDEESTGPVDWLGAGLGAVTLAALTWALTSGSADGLSPAVVAAGLVAVAAGAAFWFVEGRAASPTLPRSVFGSAQFDAANAVTFVVYGALGVVFFLLVLQLQVVSGFGPVASGTALLPVTAVMLLLSSRSGELASRIGPRLQMSLGPVVCAGGLLLLLRVGRDASYVADVLPAVLVFGLGLAVMVAPLTATALAAVPEGHAGLASGVNNAVARTGGLVAVAAVPPLAGLAGADYADPDVFGAGFRTAMLVSIVALLVGAAIAALTIRNEVLAEAATPDAAGPVGPAAPAPATQATEPEHQLRHCGVGAPPLATSTRNCERS